MWNIKLTSYVWTSRPWVWKMIVKTNVNLSTFCTSRISFCYFSLILLPDTKLSLKLQLQLAIPRIHTKWWTKSTYFKCIIQGYVLHCNRSLHWKREYSNKQINKHTKNSTFIGVLNVLLNYLSHGNRFSSRIVCSLNCANFV